MYRFLIFLLLFSCQTPFSERIKTPFVIICESVAKWSRKYNEYPYKISARILKFEVQGQLYGARNRIDGSFSNVKMRGKVVGYASDFIRLKTREVNGTADNYESKITYNFKMIGRKKELNIFIAPPDEYGYYTYGKSKYALMCKHELFRRKKNRNIFLNN